MDWSKLLQIKVRDKLRFTLTVSVVIFITLLSLYLVNLFVFHTNPFDFFKSIFFPNIKNVFVPEAVLVTIFALLVVWVLAIVIPTIYHFCQFVTNYFPFFEKTKKFTPDDCLNNLVFQGKVEKIGLRSFRVTNSDSGALIKFHYWKDFTANFKFNFKELKQSIEVDYIREKDNSHLYIKKVHRPSNNYFGFIFRAQDLDNYFMISVGIKDIVEYNKPPNATGKLSYVRKLLITPHIRLNGKWDVFSSQVYPNDRKTSLDVGKDHTIKAKLERNKLELEIVEIKENPFIWELPTNFRSSWPIEKKESRSEEYSFGDESIIHFRESYGMIGFRAYGEEHVIIDELNVTNF